MMISIELSNDVVDGKKNRWWISRTKEKKKEKARKSSRYKYLTSRGGVQAVICAKFENQTTSLAKKIKSKSH